MPDTDLAAIRERLAKATPGPWVRDCYPTGPTNWFIKQPAAENRILCTSEVESSYGMAHHPKDDFDFMSHAPTDVGRLLDEVDRLRSENIRLKETCIELWESIVRCEGSFVRAGHFDGWWDACALSRVCEAGDALVAAGLWERHPDGDGFCVFYRPLTKESQC